VAQLFSLGRSTHHKTKQHKTQMKTPVAVTLIIMGALLVMTPALSDCLYQRNLVALMSHPGITSVNLDGKMDDLYRFGCWLTGSIMVGVAVLCSLFVRRETVKHETLATNAA
jgi:hypothetical protein